MIKIIHSFKAGNIGYGNFDIICVESWKKVYPDFEIKYWTDEDCRELMEDCEYAKYFYYNRNLQAIAMDYVRIKILYEYGGLYMDSDVYAINRIDDCYFSKKLFLPWNALFEATWTNSGTCMYAEPKNPVLLELLDLYRNLHTILSKDTMENGFIDNRIIDDVFKKHGMDNSKYDCSLYNQKIDKGTEIVNRVQFGVTDAILGYNTLDFTKEPYLCHCFASVWASPIKQGSNTYYMTLNEDTDLHKFSEDINKYITTDGGNTPMVLTVFMNTLNGSEKEFVERLNYKLPQVGDTKKLWKFLNIGNHLDKRDLYNAVLDFAVKRLKNVMTCSDLALSNNIHIEGMNNPFLERVAIYYIAKDEENPKKRIDEFYATKFNNCEITRVLMNLSSESLEEYVKKYKGISKDTLYIEAEIEADTIEEYTSTLANLIVTNFKIVMFCRNISDYPLDSRDYQKL